MTAEWRRAAGFAAGLTVAVGALAGVVARMTVFVPLDRAASTVEARVGATLVVVLAVVAAATLLAALSLVPLYGVLSERVASGDVPWFVLLALGGVVCVAVGFVGVQPIAGGFADEHTETYGGAWGPHAEFAAEERTTGTGERVLRITHEGGDRLVADHVHVRGEGFADVGAADQTAPGPWRGAASGERPRRGGAAIETGDAVEVGVAGDCEVRVVYVADGRSGTLFYHECDDG